MTPILDFVVQATATLAGAVAAFSFESWRQKQRDRHERAAKVKGALYVLISQRSYLRNLLARHLEPVRDNPHRAFLLLPLTAAPTSLSLDMSALTFLLELPDKELLPSIEIADLQFRTVTAILDDRNRLHREFQHRMEQAQVGATTNAIELTALRAIIGPMLARQLETATEQLFSSVDDAIETNTATYARTDAAFRATFPKEKLWRIEDRALPSK